MAQTSTALAQDGDTETHVEVLRYLGLWLLVATCSSFTHKDF